MVLQTNTIEFGTDYIDNLCPSHISYSRSVDDCYGRRGYNLESILYLSLCCFRGCNHINDRFICDGTKTDVLELMEI